MRSQWLLTFGVVNLGCTATRMHHEVESPSIWWSATQGVCGHTVVVDVGGDVWTEKGCETGPTHLSRKRSLSEGEHEALRRAFAALPASGKPAAKERCLATQHTLRQREPGREDDVIWILCVKSADEWDSKPVVEPYRRAIELLNRARQG
jgi:hypothetical protein